MKSSKSIKPNQSYDWKILPASISISKSDIEKEHQKIPKDKRRKPHPTIRKYKLKNIKTWHDFNFALMNFFKVKSTDSMQKILEKVLFG